ncbi:MAG: ABC transporter permease [Gemmatimonadales bacterium]|nr:ABC transporter permease [Gemmatimonadales bacterium]NIN50699.1 ABC transporter permease [Gemmatimonadales bacterium]NIP08163.1 ABC transporter permease [Gemmatimonadales bacterium]NIR01041.1 ABC transporter permease [Gemmatimonadales bacterium]NIS65120.1 ABC transporter permease [Gemmatimonadales bacterium]
MKRISGLRIREMVKKELRQLLRDPRARGVLFVAPIIQLVMFGYAVNTDIRNTATFVVDQDQSSESRRLIDVLTATGYFEIVGRSQGPADLVRALDRSEALIGLEIPRGFARDLSAGRTAKVQIVLDGTESNSATVAQGYAQRIVQRFSLERAAELGLVPEGGVDLRVRAWYNPNLESRVYNVPAVVAVLIMLMCLMLTALAVVRERELGTLDQLMVSPLTAEELMLSKTLPVAAIGLVDLVLISLVAVVWFDVPIRGFPPSLLLAAVLYILAGLSIGLLISTISRTQQEAFMTMFLFLQPAIILSGFFYPISSMPQIFQWVTLLNPVRHFLEIVRAIFLKGEGLAALWPQYLALTIMAAGVLRLAIIRFPRTVRA